MYEKKKKPSQNQSSRTLSYRSHSLNRGISHKGGFTSGVADTDAWNPGRIPNFGNFQVYIVYIAVAKLGNSTAEAQVGVCSIENVHVISQLFGGLSAYVDIFSLAALLTLKRPRVVVSHRLTSTTLNPLCQCRRRIINIVTFVVAAK